MTTSRFPVSDKQRAEQAQKKRYEEEVGREPKALPEDHPYRWQWDYRGTPKERQELFGRLGIEEVEDDEPVLIEGQEELFG